MHDFLFSNSVRTRILRHSLFWICWYLFMACTTLRIYSPEVIGIKNFIYVQWTVSLVRIGLQMLFCYTVNYLIIPRFLLKRKYIQFCLAFAAFLFCFYWFSYFYYYESWSNPHSLINSLFSYSTLSPFRLQYLLFYSHLNFSGTVVSSSIVLLVRYYKSWYKKQRETESLIRENTQAELQLLKAQVHPHFLFNTLNNIYALTLDDSPKAAASVKKLSGMVHYMIHEGSASFVPVNSEVKMLVDYIGLEKIRYGERLQMHVSLSKARDDTRLIAPLLFIPFAENCFKHGASKIMGDAWIRLHIETGEDWLEFQISNSVPRNNHQPDDRKKIGLINVQRRLQFLYPDKHQLDIESTEDTFSVFMKLQLEAARGTTETRRVQRAILNSKF